MTLDDGGDEPGDRIRIDGKLLPATSYNLHTARVRSDRIEVHAATGALEKTLIIGTRPDLPNVAIITLSLKNTGRHAVHIDNIEYGRHRFNARNVEPSAQPWDVWSFLGASLKWGQSEIAPVDAKFDRANPMGLPTPTGEGGGLPVVAFWTRRMGVATGHIESRSLVLSLPVRVAADGRIETRRKLHDTARFSRRLSWRLLRSSERLREGRSDSSHERRARGL
jgi:hypothetical protein